ncbi:MAG: radical SAM protein [Methanobacteriota archaeon]
MLVRKIDCKTALSSSHLPGYDYALNPYRGCGHACIYCYAPAVLRERREWGSFVDVKINMPLVLARELRKREKGVVGISTVTDAYQPVEKKYELTRRCLEQLLKRDFPICIQTKSSLVLRDLDLIERFSQKEVGFTITTIDDEARKKYEPYSSPAGERITALEELASNGIKTWVFIGPIMPFITEKNLDSFIKELARVKVGYVLADRLRMKPGLEEKMRKFFSTHYPELASKYSGINEEYFQGVKNKIIELCKKRGIKCDGAM